MLCLEMQNQDEAKRNGVINPQNDNFSRLLTRQIVTAGGPEVLGAYVAKYYGQFCSSESINIF